MKRPIARLVGTGRYTPSKTLDNAYFEKILDTSDQWIRERTGILERRVAEPHETVAYMGTKACTQVLEDANLAADDVDVVIVATATPDRLLPSTACDLQAILGTKNAAVFDIQAACSGFLYGLSVAESMICAGSAENVLVVGGERLSAITDYSDRTTAILMGDGAGATLVQPTRGERGILSTYLKSDGRLGDLLYRPGGGGNHPPDEALLRDRGYYMRMAGREVFKSAVLCMAEAVDEALKRANLAGQDIDVLIPHQANIRIIEATAKHASVPMDKVYVNIDRYGNTSAASIPIAFDECVRDGRVREGSIVLFVAFGGGFTWGSVALRW
ncbi:MAG: beta-ketoacyl-ACP synthase III [Gemmatimonadales bacterium]|jgi:3-oxoacyl-[acyl-carrier-protein] synthase-3